MTSGITVIDRIRQCLSMSGRPQKGFHDILRPGANNLIACLKLQKHHTHTPSFPARPRTGLRSLHQPGSFQARRRVHWKPSPIGQHVRDDARIRDLDITSSYQELRRIALKGDYVHIRSNVKTLVRERAQKPNLRLYDALLLANADTQYGSAAEVVGIFEELAAEGLTPDSATYHAALRVGICARGVKYT